MDQIDTPHPSDELSNINIDSIFSSNMDNEKKKKNKKTKKSNFFKF
jgi:hypothetical protein